jgi:FkbM family methyltransferase
MDEFVAGRHLKRILDLHRIDCVLDVGANLGQFRDFAVKWGWCGTVVSFEPVPEYFDEINKRASGSWTCHRYALGDETGTQRITVFNSPGLASLREADLNAMQALLPAGNVRRERVETIEVRRLSQVLDQVAPGARRIFLKIDTQGYDLEVFRGAREVLNRVYAMWTEISFLPIYRKMPSYSEVLAEFSNSGFAVSGMFPVNYDKSLRAIEFDCALVRES